MVADISDLQRIADHRGGRFDSGLIVDADEFAAGFVESLERLGLAVVGLQTGQDGLRRVILADAQFAAAEVAHSLDFRGIVDHVEGTAAGSAGPPAAHALDDDGVLHLNGEGGVDLDAEGFHGFRLRNRARHAVEDVAVCTVGFGKALADDVVL